MNKKDMPLKNDVSKNILNIDPTKLKDKTNTNLNNNLRKCIQFKKNYKLIIYTKNYIPCELSLYSHSVIFFSMVTIHKTPCLNLEPLTIGCKLLNTSVIKLLKLL